MGGEGCATMVEGEHGEKRSQDGDQRQASASGSLPSGSLLTRLSGEPAFTGEERHPGASVRTGRTRVVHACLPTTSQTCQCFPGNGAFFNVCTTPRSLSFNKTKQTNYILQGLSSR